MEINSYIFFCFQPYDELLGSQMCDVGGHSGASHGNQTQPHMPWQTSHTEMGFPPLSIPATAVSCYDFFLMFVIGGNFEQ